MSLTFLLVFSVFIASFLGSLWRPLFGIAGYLAVYMLYNQNLWWVAGISQWIPRPSFLSVLFLITGCVLHSKKLNWRITSRELEFYLFLAVAWLASLVFGIGMTEVSWIYLEKLTKTFIFIFFLIRVVHSIHDFKFVIWVLILGGIFLSYQGHVIGQFQGSRLDNIGGIDFSEANSFASFLMLCISMLGFFLLRYSIWKKAIGTIAIALMVNTVIMCQSRAVFLGIVLALPFLVLLPHKKYRKQVCIYALLGGALFFVLSDVNFFNRMGFIGKIAENNNFIAIQPQEELNRLDFWKASVQIFKDHPMGIGVKNFELIVPKYAPRNQGLDAHNTYVLCYSELGIFGIGLFMLIIIEALFQLKRVRKIADNTLFGDELILTSTGLTLFYVIYLTGSMMTHSSLYIEFLWILLALPICLENAALKIIDTKDEILANPTL